MTATCPLRAAAINAVPECGVAAFTSAPARSRVSTLAVSPLRARRLDERARASSEAREITPLDCRPASKSRTPLTSTYGTAV